MLRSALLRVVGGEVVLTADYSQHVVLRRQVEVGQERELRGVHGCEFDSIKLYYMLILQELGLNLLLRKAAAAVKPTLTVTINVSFIISILPPVVMFLY